MQDQIAELKSQIEEVKSDLIFTKVLQRGMTGEEVKTLQKFLKKFPDLYPEGLVTGYFGSLTEMAVKRLQEKQGIERVGNVGPKTLDKLNQLITEGAGASGVVPPGLLTAPAIKNKIDASETPAPITTAATTTQAIPTIPALPVATPAPSATTNATSTPASTASLITTIASLSEKPWDVAVSGSDYIVTTVSLEKNSGHLLRITPDGKILTIASLSRRLSGVAVSGSDYYVTDGDTNVLKISSDGGVSTIAVLINNGIGTGSNFQNDIAVTTGSDIIVTDYAGGRLLRITPNGNVSMLTGGLRYPNSVIADGQNFLVLAADNNAQPYLYRVTQNGVVTPLASLAALGSLGSITKIGSYYYVNGNNGIARVSSGGAVTLIPLSISGQLISMANNGSEIIATNYGSSRLLRIALQPMAEDTTAAVPSGTIPATPAIPAQPSSGGGGSTSATPETQTTPAPTATTTNTTTDATPSVGACTSVSLSFDGNKTTYNIGDRMPYNFTCSPAGSMSPLWVQIVLPSGTPLLYDGVHPWSSGSANAGSVGGSILTSAYNLTPGTYSIRACFDLSCQNIAVSGQFTLVSPTQ